MIKVKSATYIEEYRIMLEFSNGQQGMVDLKDDLWGPIFEPLKNIEEFKKFVVDKVFDTISWKNGADLSPEYLYEKILEPC